MRVIAVWGVNGGGKSLVSIATAHRLTQKKKNVIVISADRVTPMFSTYLPYVQYTPNFSLGKLLDGNITEEKIGQTIQAHKKNERLAFLSLGEMDSYQRYRGNWSTAKIEVLMQYLEKMCDFVILDLTSNFFADNFTLWALERADRVISVANPDNRSTSFFTSYKILLNNDAKYDISKHIPVLNNCYSYSPYERYMKEYEYEYWLPHAYEVYGNFIAGTANIIGGSDKDTKVFKKTIMNLVKRELLTIE